MRIIKVIPLFISLFVLNMAFPVLAQPEQQKEYVQVINVEMILRVLKDGAPVAGLKKSDFSLFEDGVQCEINGFFENHRLIAHGEGIKKETQQPRLYLLFFWVNNPAVDAEGVMDRFFSDIYREGDRVILSTPLKTFELRSPQEVTDVRAAFITQWRQEANSKLTRRLQFQQELNRMLEDVVRRLNEIGTKEKESDSYAERQDNPTAREISQFASQYAQAVKEFQIREFSPDLTAFEAMVRSMIPAQSDKFALVFFQHDTLPLFDINNAKNLFVTKRIHDNLIDKMTAHMLNIEEQVKNIFNVHIFSEQLKSLFIQANIQFHLLSLSPDRSERRASADAVFSLTKNKEVFSNWDQIMGEISKISGGLQLDGDRLSEALDQVIAFEDIYYHITYVPRGQGGKERKIDIQVNRPGMKVIHGRKLEFDELPLLKIAALSVTDQSIQLGIVDYYPIVRDGVPTGFVNVNVTGRQTDTETPQALLTQSGETTGTIKMPLAFPKPGNWDLEVRVTDQITGHQDLKKSKVEIAAVIPAFVSPGDPAIILTELLSKAAAYAEKLKKAAFHFICREDVTEDTFASSIIKNNVAVPPRTHWLYDYQIVARDRKIAENRVLLKKNQEKIHLANAQLETVFHSYFSFYMPATMLAKEKQRFYQYRLLGREKINNKNVWHISASRRTPEPIPWGEVWIGEENGTVYKIQVDQTSIVGFDKMAQKAIEKGFMPAITTIHEYSLEKQGLRFPSKTTFIEKYNSSQSGSTVRPTFERSRTVFEYRDHMFFSVATQVEEKNE